MLIVSSRSLSLSSYQFFLRINTSREVRENRDKMHQITNHQISKRLCFIKKQGTKIHAQKKKQTETKLKKEMSPKVKNKQILKSQEMLFMRREGWVNKSIQETTTNRGIHIITVEESTKTLHEMSINPVRKSQLMSKISRNISS